MATYECKGLININFNKWREFWKNRVIRTLLKISLDKIINRDSLNFVRFEIFFSFPRK